MNSETSSLLTFPRHSPRFTFQSIGIGILLILSILNLILNASTTASTSTSLVAKPMRAPMLNFRQTPSTSRLPNILIVYVDGHYQSLMAQQVAKGTYLPSAHVRCKSVDQADYHDDVFWADGIILGTPVINSNVHPKLQAWIDGWDFHADLSTKVGAVFVTAGGISAGEELTMVNLLHTMLIFRFVLVGGERWTSAFGASAVVNEGPFQANTKASAAALDELFREKAVGLGERVRTVAERMIR